jgi:hypothetical protein
MRALLAAVIVMGVLIVAGVATIAVTIVSRMSSGGSAVTGAVAQAMLEEPAGTRIAGISLAADRVALQLQGGGADRVVVVETRSGRVIARVALAR